MARIASFTSSGTPTGPRSTLAELMARKKMLAEQQGEIVGPHPIESWTQGAAQLAQAFVNARQQSAAAEELATGREQLAGAMSGIDWTKGPTPEQQSTIYGLDPDLGLKIISDLVQSRRNAAEPLTEVAQIKADLAAGRITQAEADAAITKATTPSSGVTVQNIEGKGESKFAETVGAKQAEIITGLYGEAVTANQDALSIDALEKSLSGVQTGAGAGFRLWANQNLGLKLGEDVDDLAAADAIINRLVPSQRAPGSGPMSDRDIQLFRQSLPNIMNQPGGNQKIIQYLKGIVAYRQAQGDIAARVMNNQLDRDAAFGELARIPNPLADFGRAADEKTDQSQTGTGVGGGEQSVYEVGKTYEFTDSQGKPIKGRYKGGDVGAPGSWEILP